MTIFGGRSSDAGIPDPKLAKNDFMTLEKQDLRGEQAMPGKVDEGKWENAKAAAKKEYPNWTEDNPRFWKVVSTIYKNMGGTFSKEKEKSMAAIEAVELITPTFIEHPGLWVQALQKSGVDVNDSKHILDNIGMTMRFYAEMGGHLQSPAAFLEKAKQVEHAYTDKVPKAGGGFSYKYENGKAGEKPKGEEKITKDKNPVPQAAAPTKTDYARAIEKLAGKNEKMIRQSLQNVDYDHLEGMHKEMRENNPAKKILAEIMHDKKAVAKREGQAKKPEKPKASAPPKGVSEKSQGGAESVFNEFCESNYEEVKKSLGQSHPEWNEGVLIERTSAQLRQMFKRQ